MTAERPSVRRGVRNKGSELAQEDNNEGCHEVEHSEPMADDPSNFVGQNLRRLRTKRGLSMERLARLSSVSRAMLSQIELAQSVPTIGVLWRVAKALGVPFAALIEQPKNDNDCVILRRSESRVESAPDSGYRARPLHPLDPPQPIEFFEVELESRSEPMPAHHAVGARAYLAVVDGTVDVNAKGQSHVLQKGDSMALVADQPYSYRNNSERRAVIYVVVVHAQPLG